MERLVRLPNSKHFKNMIFIFHRWGDSFMNTDDGEISITRGILEDSETGKVYEIEPKEIKFLTHMERNAYLVEKGKKESSELKGWEIS